MSHYGQRLSILTQWLHNVHPFNLLHFKKELRSSFLLFIGSSFGQLCYDLDLYPVISFFVGVLEETQILSIQPQHNCLFHLALRNLQCTVYYARLPGQEAFPWPRKKRLTETRRFIILFNPFQAIPALATRIELHQKRCAIIFQDPSHAWGSVGSRRLLAFRHLSLSKRSLLDLGFGRASWHYGIGSDSAEYSSTGIPAGRRDPAPCRCSAKQWHYSYQLSLDGDTLSKSLLRRPRNPPFRTHMQRYFKEREILSPGSVQSSKIMVQVCTIQYMLTTIVMILTILQISKNNASYKLKKRMQADARCPWRNGFHGCKAHP